MPNNQNNEKMTCECDGYLDCKRNFLGFEKCSCAKCGRHFERQLATGYRVTYWILGGWFFLALLKKLPEIISSISLSYPSVFIIKVMENWFLILFVIGVFIALRKDSRLKHAVQNVPATARPANTIKTPPTEAEHTMNNQSSVNAMPAITIESSQQSMQETEDRLYEQITQEIETNAVDKGTWTKAYAQCGGDDKQTRVTYIKTRFEKLLAVENARLEACQREWENAEALQRLYPGMAFRDLIAYQREQDREALQRKQEEIIRNVD